MDFGKLNKLVLRGGLSIVAALLLSSAAFAQDAATDDGVTHQVIVDEGGVAIDDGAVPDDQNGDNTGADTEPATGDDDLAVDEPDPNDGDDVSYDDPGVDPGTDIEGGGEVVIYYMDGGPCIDCNVVAPGRPTNPSEVERTLTTAAPATNAPPAAVATSRRHHSSAAAFVVTTSMAQCMTQHPRSAWICEWQNGAGQ